LPREKPTRKSQLVQSEARKRLKKKKKRKMRPGTQRERRDTARVELHGTSDHETRSKVNEQSERTKTLKEGGGELKIIKNSGRDSPKRIFPPAKNCKKPTPSVRCWGGECWSQEGVSLSRRKRKFSNVVGEKEKE